MSSQHARASEEAEAALRRRRSQAREARIVVVRGESTTTEKDVNECAEDFIKKFRQQLRLQRLESIENYKQMLERGL